MSNIDDIFKEGLKNAGMPYADSHWSAMEKQLPVKTAWPWWKLMAGGMGVCMVTIDNRYRRQAMRTKLTYRRRSRPQCDDK